MSTLVKEIPLAGLSTAPSDYECQDGNLAAAIGVVHEGGAILNAAHSSPKTVKTFSTTEKVIHQHITSDSKNLIVKGEGTDSLYWTKTNISNKNSFGISSSSFKHIESVGNTLIIYTTDGANYFLWKNGKYTSIGHSVPEIDIQFGLQGETKIYYYKTQEQINSGLNKPKESESAIQLGDEAGWTFNWTDFSAIPDFVRTPVTEGVMSKVNKFVAESAKEGRFTMPFLVRYAYRLYDGSLTMHSSPVLMIPATNAPLVPIHAVYPEDETWYFHVIGTSAVMSYEITGGGSLDDWKDIIRAVEIYVSAPFYTYDQSGQVSRIIADGFRHEIISEENYLYLNADKMYWKHLNGYSVMAQHSLDNDSVATSTHEKKKTELYSSITGGVKSSYSGNRSENYRSFEGREGYEYTMHWGKNVNLNVVFRDDHDIETNPCFFFFELPERDWSKIATEAKECSNFYFLKEIPVSDIRTGRSEVIKADNGELSAITAQLTMTDDFGTHDTMIPEITATYNSRLNMADITFKKYSGYSPSSMFPKVNAGTYNMIYFVTINSSNGNLVLMKEGTTDSAKDVSYFFYPDPEAVSVTMYIGSSYSSYNKKITLPLSEHKGLNGAISRVSLYDTIFESISMTRNEVIAEAKSTLGYAEGEVSYNVKNLIYTSEVNNPFLFRAENVEQISSGSIIALVPSSIALGAGQFGEYPMYCFTTDGIWTLVVNSTGGWASAAPVSRDVPLTDSNGKNPCILQLDQTIIFATERGLMQLSGSSLECITELFDGTADQFISKYASHMADVLKTQNTNISNSNHLFIPFKDFLQNGNMNYDYTHQRIIVSNPNYKFCFIFNMKDKLWTAEILQVLSPVNSYPESYAMVLEGSNNYLIDFTKHNVSSGNIAMPSDGYILTRPLKLDNADTMKTIRTVVVRGNFERQNVDVIVYGSRDMNNWLLVGSAKGNRFVSRHGTPYKYFRVAVISRIGKDESLSGLTIEFETKETDKIR